MGEGARVKEIGEMRVRVSEEGKRVESVSERRLRKSSRVCG